MKTSLKLIKKKSTGYEFETSRCHLDMIYAHQLTDVDVEVARLSYSFKKKNVTYKNVRTSFGSNKFSTVTFPRRGIAG